MRGCAVFFFAAAIALAGCGGGGSSSGSGSALPTVTSAPKNAATTAPALSSTPTPTPTATTSTSTSQTIAAAGGGTVSALFHGQTLSVGVPAGALSVSTTVTLTVYANAGLPRTFQSQRRRSQALPAAANFIIGMSVSIGSATLLKPLTFSLTNAPNVTAGTAIRLAASRQGSFGDVDTATETNGTISEAQNPAYAGASLAGPSILYAFYSTAAASELPPPTITLGVSGPASVIVGSQTPFSASEVDANGFPVLTSSYGFSIDSAALGTIDPASGILTASTANNAAGHVIATDRATTSLSGSLLVTILSSRPATAGDSLSYAGTFASVIANNGIASSPVSSSQSASVTQTTAVSAGSANQVVLTASEADTFQLSTLSTKTTSTIAYQSSGSSTLVRMLQSSATDSNNATYQTQYSPTSGLLAVEPENPGAFGPNDASQTYSETDPGISVGSSGQNVTTTRTTAASGSYSETTTNADASTNTAVQNADGTGTYAIDSSAAAPANLTFGLPTTGASATIPITLVTGQAKTSQTVNAPLWYASPLTIYTEADTIAAASAYDSRCNVPAMYGTASSKVVETLTSVDIVYGNLENQVTTTYDVAGVGTVCSIFTDTTQTFYDYTRQEPNFITFNATAAPILSTTTTEILSLTAATVSGQPVSTASLKRAASSMSRLAVVVSRERFRHAVHQAKIAQAVRMATFLRHLRGVQ